jgi:hypothetical protein
MMPRRSGRGFGVPGEADVTAGGLQFNGRKIRLALARYAGYG